MNDVRGYVIQEVTIVTDHYQRLLPPSGQEQWQRNRSDPPDYHHESLQFPHVKKRGMPLNNVMIRSCRHCRVNLAVFSSLLPNTATTTHTHTLLGAHSCPSRSVSPH